MSNRIHKYMPAASCLRALQLSVTWLIAGSVAVPIAWSQKVVRSHDTALSVAPFDLQLIRKLGSTAAFQKESCAPPEARDMLDYFDATEFSFKLSTGGPFLLGKLVVKQDGCSIKGTGDPLPRGEYYHYFGKKDDVWISGYTPLDGEKIARCEVRFGVEASEKQRGTHMEVFAHSPEDAAHFHFAAAGLPGRQPPGGGTLPPGGRRPPGGQKEPPSKDPRPNEPGHNGNRPKCVPVYKLVYNADSKKWEKVQTDWITK